MSLVFGKSMKNKEKHITQYTYLLHSKEVTFRNYKAKTCPFLFHFYMTTMSLQIICKIQMGH